MKNTWLVAYIACLIRDIIVVALFTELAMRFDKWWIVLFSVCFFQSVSWSHREELNENNGKGVGEKDTDAEEKD